VAEQPVHLFPFCKDMFVPGKSSAEVQSEVIGGTWMSLM
jgi:hypothetical protein